MSEMSEADAAELAARRAYDDFMGHLRRAKDDGALYDFYIELTEQFLEECGAPEKMARRIGQHLVWWASVIAKTHGWFTWVVAVSCILAITAVLATYTVKDLLPSLRS